MNQPRPGTYVAGKRQVRQGIYFFTDPVESFRISKRPCPSGGSFLQVFYHSPNTILHMNNIPIQQSYGARVTSLLPEAG